jgi:hypothetical protein
VFHAISINVVMRSNGLFELVTDDHARSFGSWSTRKDHDASPSIWECRLREFKKEKEANNASATYLQQTYSDTHGDTHTT